MDPYRDPDLVELYDVDKGRVVFDAHNVFPDGEDRIYTSVLFFRTAEELTRELDSAGFTDLAVCGSWHGAPVEDSSRILVFRATRGRPGRVPPADYHHQVWTRRRKSRAAGTHC